MEYSFPEQMIGAGKTFVYLDSVNDKKTYTDISLSEKNNSKYLIERQYTAGGTIDSSIYLNSKLIEEYQSGIANQQTAKADILQDSVVDNGTKMGKRIFNARFNYDAFSISIESESEFFKDTTFTWHEESKGTVVIKSSYRSTFRSKLDTLLRKDLSTIYFSYLAKEIGTVKILTLLNNKWTTRELIEIKDFSN